MYRTAAVLGGRRGNGQTVLTALASASRRERRRYGFACLPSQTLPHYQIKKPAVRTEPKFHPAGFMATLYQKTRRLWGPNFRALRKCECAGAPNRHIRIRANPRKVTGACDCETSPKKIFARFFRLKKMARELAFYREISKFLPDSFP